MGVAYMGAGYMGAANRQVYALQKIGETMRCYQMDPRDRARMDQTFCTRWCSMHSYTVGRGRAVVCTHRREQQPLSRDVWLLERDESVR